MQQQHVEGPKKSFEEVVIPYLESLLEAIKTGATMAQEELPELIEQYIVFHALMEWLMVLMGILFIPIGYILYKKIPTAIEPLNYIAAGACWVSSLFCILNHIQIAIMATFFPKLFLVEEFLKLL